MNLRGKFEFASSSFLRPLGQGRPALWILFWGLLTATAAWGGDAPEKPIPARPHELKLEPIRALTAQSDIRGLEYLGEKGHIPHGENVLFIHGLGSSEDQFLEYNTLETVKSRDMNVFTMNLPGFGKKSQRSIIPGHPRADDPVYGVDHYIRYDIPAMVEEIYQKTGKKVHIIGHSMGGMTGKNATLFSDKIASVTPIGSPPTFKNHHWSLKAMASQPGEAVAGAVVHRIPQPGSRVPILEKAAQGNLSLAEKARRKLQDPVVRWIIKNNLFPQGVGDFSNMSVDAGVELAYHAHSTIPKFTMKDFVRYMRTGDFMSRDGHHFWGGHREFNVPMFLAAAGKDALALASDIRREAKEMATRGTKVFYREIPEMSHLEAGAGDLFAAVVLPHILDFVDYVSGKPGAKEPLPVGVIHISPETRRGVYRRARHARRCRDGLTLREKLFGIMEFPFL